MGTVLLLRFGRPRRITHQELRVVAKLHGGLDACTVLASVAVLARVQPLVPFCPIPVRQRRRVERPSYLPTTTSLVRLAGTARDRHDLPRGRPLRIGLRHVVEVTLGQCCSRSMLCDLALSSAVVARSSAARSSLRALLRSSSTPFTAAVEAASAAAAAAAAACHRSRPALRTTARALSNMRVVAS